MQMQRNRLECHGAIDCLQTPLLPPYGHRLQQLTQHFLTLRPPHPSWRAVSYAPTEPDGGQRALMLWVEALSARIRADAAPGPMRAYGLRHWGQQEGIPSCHILQQLQARDYGSVQRYYAQLLADHHLSHATLDQVDQLMGITMTIPTLDAQSALALIQRYFEQADPNSANWLQQFIKRQRLQLRNASTDMAWCLDTHFGACVRVDYQPDFPNLMTLMHELGHARHQDWHRAHSSRPLRVIEKETAAFSAEQGLLRWLLQEPQPYPRAAQAYQHYLQIEMVARQQMLSQFEFDLYSLPTVKHSAIRALWQHHLTQFYGHQIILEAADIDAWSTLPQLLSAPFYRLSYPIAYARTMAPRSATAEWSSLNHERLEQDQPALQLLG